MKKNKKSQTTSDIKKSYNNTLRATKVFLTIPHFDKVDQTYEMLELKSKELLIERFAVVLETHTQNKDKKRHLHVFVKFIKLREISFKFFDFLGKHGKLERVRSEEAILQYMNKENVCKSSFDVWLPLLQSVNFTRTIINMHQHGWNQDEILLQYGTKVTGSKPWRAAFDLAVRREIAKVNLDIASNNSRMREITTEIISKRLSNEEQRIYYANTKFQELIDVVNRALKYGNMHDYKACCVSIVGIPSIGKSTFVRCLKKHFTTYNFPLDGWHNNYVNGINELILWNEWDIKLMSRSDLLLFTEGEIVDLKIKFTKAVKKDRPLILMTSNETWRRQVYRRYSYDQVQRDVVLASLDTRIQEINFEDTPIWFLTKLFVSVNDDI